MTLWMVRSGRYGERENLCLDKNLAIIGWEEVPDLSRFRERRELAQALESTYPEEKGKTLTNWESQLWPFANAMAVGDLVAMPLKHRAAIALGTVAGDYRYRTDIGEARHTRPIEWTKEIPRAAFAQDLLYSFGSIMTVCRVQRNNAEQRVASILRHGRDPAIQPATSPARRPSTPAVEPVSEEASRTVDLAELADDGIRQRIGTVFKGHKLSALIGAILQAQGYRVVVSPPGADGGVDIVAGRGVLGFDEPRLVVQVKSQESSVDVGVLRELQGVMRQFGAQHGLLVAWGGVTKALAKEAQRLFFEIRIWDSGEVVKALQNNYDQLSGELQSDIPLKRIWALADDATGLSTV
jgi:restriction system protein